MRMSFHNVWEFLGARRGWRDVRGMSDRNWVDRGFEGEEGGKMSRRLILRGEERREVVFSFLVYFYWNIYLMRTHVSDVKFLPYPTMMLRSLKADFSLRSQTNFESFILAIA